MNKRPLRSVRVAGPRHGRLLGGVLSRFAYAVELISEAIDRIVFVAPQEATTTEWGSVVEKLSIRLKQQAVEARAEALARTLEKLRSLHTGLPVRMADSEFDRVWYGHCPVEAGLKPVALGPEPLKDDGAA